MRKFHNGIIEIILGLSITSCGYENTIVRKDGIAVVEDTISCEQIWGEPECGILTVWKDVDLENKQCRLPKGVTINFQGGVIKNGTLVGDETRIENTGVCFDRVRIIGTWNVPEISTSMFKDLDYDNSLKDVMALANPDMTNRIVIEEGEYQVSVQRSGGVCLVVGNDTELIVNGTIRLTPNALQSYHIIEVNGENVVVRGKGTIIGDRHIHAGNAGEWGMGIMIRHANNVSLSGLTIKDCWGDCVYVGGNSKKVLIENCHLDHGRRQGISITSADGVTIKDCTISNVGGTAPECAIDVEPNKGNVVDHVVIDNIIAKDCKGGIGVNKNAEDAKIGSVSIRNCKISAVRKAMANINACDTAIVEENDLTQELGQRGVVCKNNNYVVVKNNIVKYNGGIVLGLWKLARKVTGRAKVHPIDISDCGTTDIVGNREIKL